MNQNEPEFHKSRDYKMWTYFYRDLAKLNVLAEVNGKLIEIIDIKNNRYDHAFQLFLDGFTTTFYITLHKFFDPRKDSWSLYKFAALQQNEVDQVKEMATEFIEDRNKKYAHLDISRDHVGHFNILSKAGVNKIRKIIDAVNHLLVEVSGRNNWSESYVLDFIGATSSVENLIDDLKKFDHMKEYEEQYATPPQTTQNSE